MSAAVASATKKFEPFLIELRNGVAHMLVRVGDVLLYVESSVVDSSRIAKAWVIGKAGTTQKRIADGVLLVQTLAGGTYDVCVNTRSNLWTRCIVRSYESVQLRLHPVMQSAFAAAHATRDRIYKVSEPMLMKTKNGCVYLQSSMGNVVIRVRLGALARYQGAVLAMQRSTAPAVERGLAVFEKVRIQLTSAFGPYLQQFSAIRSGIIATLGEHTVAVKVRTAKAREFIMRYPTMCFVKVKGSSIYVYGVVGEKVVGIKVRFNDLAAEANTKMIATFGGSVKDAASDRIVQASAATGLAAGTFVGAAVGIIPAIFTFGLSIPIGAAIGASAGVLTGGAVGVAGSGIARKMSSSKVRSRGASVEDAKQSSNDKDADSSHSQKQAEPENMADPKAMLPAAASTYPRVQASGHVWSADYAFSLGQAVDNHDHTHQFLDAEKYPSVVKAVDALNAGRVSCQEGICIVRSERQKLYFMIARSDKREECAPLAQTMQEQEQRNLILGAMEELNGNNAVVEQMSVNSFKAVATARDDGATDVVVHDAVKTIMNKEWAPTKEEN